LWAGVATPQAVSLAAHSFYWKPILEQKMQTQLEVTPSTLPCKETEDCKGELKRFLYSESSDGVHEQYQCTCCRKYVKSHNGNFFSAGKYNSIA